MSRSACLAMVSEQHFNVPDSSVAVFFIIMQLWPIQSLPLNGT